MRCNCRCYHSINITYIVYIICRMVASILYWQGNFQMLMIDMYIYVCLCFFLSYTTSVSSFIFFDKCWYSSINRKANEVHVQLKKIPLPTTKYEFLYRNQEIIRCHMNGCIYMMLCDEKNSMKS